MRLLFLMIERTVLINLHHLYFECISGCDDFVGVSGESINNRSVGFSTDGRVSLQAAAPFCYWKCTEGAKCR
jgi:hypothetical protein